MRFAVKDLTFRKKMFSTFCIVGLGAITVHADEFIHYKVKKSDNLTKILRSLNLSPVFGKHGYLKDVIALNPKTVKRKGNLIRIGDELIMPVKIIQKQIASQPTEEAIVNPENNKQLSTVEPIQVVANGGEFTQYSYFRIAPAFSLVSVNSNDDVHLGGTSVSNLTKPVVGLRGEWHLVLTPETSLNTFASYDRLQFYKDTTYSLSNTDFSRVDFGVGVERKIDAKSAVNASLQINQNYFLEVVNPVNVQVRTLSQGEANLEYKRDVFVIKRVKGYLGAGGLLILPSSRDQYSGKMGYGLTATTGVKFLSKELQISYTQKKFKVNDVDNTSKEIVARLNFSFGEEK